MSTDKTRADKFRIDSHKLNLHPQRVADWLNGKIIAPIYMEVSPSGACNHRCSFCGLDFMGYKANFLPTELFSERLAEMGEYGLKSIMFAGEGEPLLHKNIITLSENAKKSGIDIAFTTNAVLLTPEKSEELLPITSWIKVSCNAGTKESYAKIHGTNSSDFDKVLANIEQAVIIRKKQNSSCTIGMQMILLPENRDSAFQFAQKIRGLGVDYLVIKPYSQHPQGISNNYENVCYSDCDILAQQLESLNTNTFKCIFRYETMHRQAIGKKAYNRCQALPFWSYIDAKGNVWGCSVFLSDERFIYGNINRQNFKEIWESNVRKRHLEWIANSFDASNCRINCRMDAINAYLWELTHPNAHVNFI